MYVYGDDIHPRARVSTHSSLARSPRARTRLMYALPTLHVPRTTLSYTDLMACAHQLNRNPTPHPTAWSSQDDGVRPDGRALDSFRHTTVATGEIGTADGSALVRLGDTAVVAGVKAELGNPPIDRPDTGWLVPNVTIPQMCSPDVKPGPPVPEAQTLSLHLANVLGGSLDVKQLCLATGKLSWVLHVTVTVLNQGGNLTDACTLAAVAALRDVRLPQLSSVDADADELPSVLATPAVPLALSDVMVAVSFARCCGQILADPTNFEETLATQTVTLVKSGTNDDVMSVLQPSPSAGQHVGSAVVGGEVCGLDADTMKQLYALSSRRAKELMALLDAADASRKR
eukprot:m.11455 g.11455  ORF g.11455 m.11455 type:complete len:343 (+) comp2844_c0_seq2:302-1330(+)